MSLENQAKGISSELIKAFNFLQDDIVITEITLSDLQVSLDEMELGANVSIKVNGKLMQFTGHETYAQSILNENAVTWAVDQSVEAYHSENCAGLSGTPFLYFYPDSKTKHAQVFVHWFTDATDYTTSSMDEDGKEMVNCVSYGIGEPPLKLRIISNNKKRTVQFIKM
jgi:hypothetical protein